MPQVYYPQGIGVGPVGPVPLDDIIDAEPQQVLYGAPNGHVEQSPDFTFEEDTQFYVNIDDATYLTLDPFGADIQAEYLAFYTGSGNLNWFMQEGTGFGISDQTDGYSSLDIDSANGGGFVFYTSETMQVSTAGGDTQLNLDTDIYAYTEGDITNQTVSGGAINMYAAGGFYAESTGNSDAYLLLSGDNAELHGDVDVSVLCSTGTASLSGQDAFIQAANEAFLDFEALRFETSIFTVGATAQTGYIPCVVNGVARKLLFGS